MSRGLHVFASTCTGCGAPLMWRKYARRSDEDRARVARGDDPDWCTFGYPTCTCPGPGGIVGRVTLGADLLPLDAWHVVELTREAVEAFEGSG